jgi:hypothetical protein
MAVALAPAQGAVLMSSQRQVQLMADFWALLNVQGDAAVVRQGNNSMQAVACSAHSIEEQARHNCVLLLCSWPLTWDAHSSGYVILKSYLQASKQANLVTDMQLDRWRASFPSNHGATHSSQQCVATAGSIGIVFTSAPASCPSSAPASADDICHCREQANSAGESKVYCTPVSHGHFCSRVS